MKILHRTLTLIAALAFVFLALPANATVWDIARGGTTAWAGTPGEPHSVSYYIDTATGVSGHEDGVSTNTLTNAHLTTSTSGTYIVFRIPANTVITGVVVNVLKAEGTACTMNVGDSASSTTWISAANMNTVSVKNSLATYATVTSPTTALALPIGMGKYYASANYIVIATSVPMSHGVFRIRVTGIQYQ